MYPKLNKMIKNIHLKNLRNNEFVQFFENIREIVSKNNPEAILVQEQYKAFIKPLTTLQLNHKRIKGSSITYQLTKIDKRRNIALRSIYKIIEAYTHHYNSDVCTVAIDLKKELDVYGKEIVRYNYQYETNVIDEILQKWAPKAEGIASLNLTEWVGELKEANTLFNTRYLDRIKESAGYTNIKVIELRKIVTLNYSELMGFISAYATIQKTEIYTKVIDQINALINQYNKILTSRHSKKSTTDNTVDNESIDNQNITTEKN